jgi:hypothetical protein
MVGGGGPMKRMNEGMDEMREERERERKREREREGRKEESSFDTEILASGRPTTTRDKR